MDLTLALFLYAYTSGMRQGPAVFLLIVVFIGGCYVFADMFGILPDSGYVAQWTSFFAPDVASAPYFQKFEGKWQIVLDNSGSSSTCSGTSGIVVVHNGMIFGSVGPFGTARTIRAAIAPDGTLEGKLDPGTQRDGSVSGTISGTAGHGSWKDSFDCAGSVSMTKTDPVVDPTAGRIANLTGTITLVRGGQKEDTYPGEPLYVGDTLTAVAGHATLSLGLYPPTIVSLSEGDTYVVPKNFQ